MHSQRVDTNGLRMRPHSIDRAVLPSGPSLSSSRCALLRAKIASSTSLRSSRRCGCDLCSFIDSAAPAVAPSITARRKSRFFLGEILKVLQISSKSKLEIHLGVGGILGRAANVLPLL